jgi:hypothetical protein
MTRFSFAAPTLAAALMMLAAAPAGIPPKSGAQMCALTYCVYAGKSAATGGIELDVFYPAGVTPADIKETFETAIGEASSTLKPLKLPGADAAQWSPTAKSGGPAFATVAVRRASLVFTLGIPASKDAETQLSKLATLLLQRF